MYGAKNVVPKAASHLLQMLKKPDFLVPWLLPFSIFLCLELLYSFSYLSRPTTCVLLTCSSLCISGALFLFHERVRLFLPLAAMLLAATCAGSFVGLYIYDSFAIYPRFYENTRLYTNVVPSAPAASVADAGKIVFSSDTVIDEEQSTSFVSARGDVYCVAPIRDGSSSLTVQFWAVGMGCCEQGKFNCYADGEKDAHAGAVVFDYDGIFSTSSHTQFRQARLKAMATYAASSADQPKLIEWAKQDNLDKISDSYQVKATVSLAVCSVMYLLLSALLAKAVYRPNI